MLPMLSFCTIMGLTGVFRIYRESYALFGNYPQPSAYMLQNYIINSFEAMNAPQLTASGVGIAVMLGLILSLLLPRLSAKIWKK
jgi:multiple sugar transport system permease protein